MAGKGTLMDALYLPLVCRRIRALGSWDPLFWRASQPVRVRVQGWGCRGGAQHLGQHREAEPGAWRNPH